MIWLIYVFYYLFHVIESSLGTWGLGQHSFPTLRLASSRPKVNEC